MWHLTSKMARAAPCKSYVTVVDGFRASLRCIPQPKGRASPAKV
jgi:hypothetical protein